LPGRPSHYGANIKLTEQDSEQPNIKPVPSFFILLLTSFGFASPNQAASQLASYPPDLQRGIDAVHAFEVPGRPCLALEWRASRFTNLRREREIQSDSNWLNAHLAKTYPERLLSSGLARRGGRFVYVIRLTGRQRIPPQRLHDRAANVPVIIEYDAPWSLAEIKLRAGKASDRSQGLVSDIQGTSIAADPGFGAVRMESIRQAVSRAPMF